MKRPTEADASEEDGQGKSSAAILERNGPGGIRETRRGDFVATAGRGIWRCAPEEARGFAGSFSRETS